MSGTRPGEPSVLVVDDDEDTRELLAAIIERAGYSVVTAANGCNALALLRVSSPELVLLDVCMPFMDGATFRQEQRRNPQWLRIPTVVITGAYDEPILDPAIAAALRKPVRAKDVLDLVGRYCTRRSGNGIENANVAPAPERESTDGTPRCASKNPRVM